MTNDIKTAGDLAAELEATDVLKAIGEQLKDVREICGPCARHFGGQCGCHTVSLGACEVCKRASLTAPISDWRFHPLVGITYIWD